MPVFLEEAHILTGMRRGRVWLMRCRRRSDGAPASVEADWRWTLEREERFHDVVGFYHTHPPAAGAAPSRRDVRTMQAWCSALGKPLLCVISCDGRALSTRFADDEDGGLALPVTEAFAGGIFVAVEDSHG
jgi:proteasome lid subunit RPN8/RPN11